MIDTKQKYVPDIEYNLKAYYEYKETLYSLINEIEKFEKKNMKNNASNKRVRKLIGKIRSLTTETRRDLIRRERGILRK